MIIDAHSHWPQGRRPAYWPQGRHPAEALPARIEKFAKDNVMVARPMQSEILR
jgi:hypothetical protein